MQGTIFGKPLPHLVPGLDQRAGELFWQNEATTQLVPMRPLVSDIITASPYLRGLFQEHADFAASLASADPQDTLAAIIAQCVDAANLESEQEVSRALRQCKAKAALLIAVADLAGTWTGVQVTAALTAFADVCVQSALSFLLFASHKSGKLNLADITNPQKSSGYIVLAMGKHGAGELNYSSDIDLIILYDSQTAPLAPAIEPSTFFVRLTRNLVALLQDLTEDGYVFRVDLRLRPDPRATQIAIDLEAAATYYENQGQNWERAAMIKARPCAGDLDLGREFVGRLQPYIWRRYLDFAAIADIQSLKRQINDVTGHGEIAIEGHNLKLGRGGIREIEFFVQTQQLIAGGKNRALRVNRTVDALAALATAGWITDTTAAELTNAYWFLRQLEHRVQMIEDRQDHCVPKEAAAFENYARFSGFENGVDLSAKLRETLQTVSRHYQVLFKDTAELGTAGGNLVFTGGEDDPATLETLATLGFRQASEMSATIRGWHFGRYNATRSRAARELLTELMPKLLEALAATGDADGAFNAFDSFIRGLPAGVQLFSMLRSNPQLLDLLTGILGKAPRLTAILAQQPRVLEAVLDPEFFGPLPGKARLQNLLADQLKGVSFLEEAMDRTRIFSREQNFRVGVRILSETMDCREAGQGFSDVADTVLTALHNHVTADIKAKHGKLAGGVSAIIALGKLGGREMTGASDLDLMLVYDYDGQAEASDGKRPLSPTQYYARLTQHLVTALTAPTAEGSLYEVDMRLRPSGSKGPVAVSLSSFKSYHQDSAWTWEKLALTRARVVSAPNDFCIKLNAIIAGVLAAPRDRAQTLTDVRDMRKLMLREKGLGTVWDIKTKRGGMIEIEFVAQTLQILSTPPVWSPNTGAALQQLQSAGLLPAKDAASLTRAWELYSSLIQIIRLCVNGDYVPESAPPSLNNTLARAATMPDILSTVATLLESQAEVIDIFDELIGNPIS
jgi:[glutamine synthetase] adenylyltransferase / [glutamine synthetase]-adenylyl-L-tyrosine phosphorylase